MTEGLRRLAVCAGLAACSATPRSDTTPPPAASAPAESATPPTSPDPAATDPVEGPPSAASLAAERAAKLPPPLREEPPPPPFGPARSDILPRDDAGREAARGTYFFELQAEGQRQSRKLLARALTFEADPDVRAQISDHATHWVVSLASPRTDIDQGWRWEGHAIVKGACALDGSLVQGGPGGRLLSTVRFTGAPSPGARAALRDAAGLLPVEVRQGLHDASSYALPRLLVAGLDAPARLEISPEVVAIGPLFRPQPHVSYFPQPRSAALIDAATARALGLSLGDFDPPLAAADPATPDGLALRVDLGWTPPARQTFGPYRVETIELPGAARGIAVGLHVAVGTFRGAPYTRSRQRWVLETRRTVRAAGVRWIGVADGLLFAAFADAEATPPQTGLLALRTRDGAVFRLEIAGGVALGDPEELAAAELQRDSAEHWRLCLRLDPSDPSSRRTCNEGLALDVAALDGRALRVQTLDGRQLELPLSLLEERLAARDPGKPQTPPNATSPGAPADAAK
ncbi:MAG: hypothetical protein KC486_14280 [Myxococcales bacterium]|nr:hypothetical protein [Myxococcales bacterium]